MSIPNHITRNRIGLRTALAALAVVTLVPVAGRAQSFATGVAARNANPSPGGGLSAGESNSRVDDYINQDEQINLGPGDGVIRVLRSNQKNVINDYVTEAIPVSNVLISEMNFVTKQMTAPEGGWAEVFFNKADGTNHISVVCPERQLPWLRDAIAGLDKPWLRLFDDGSFQTIYHARNRPVSLVTAISDGWAPFGSTEVDPRANIAVHSDEEAWTQKWHAASWMIDMPVHQADLDVTVYEIETDSGLRLGLDYIAWKNGPGRNLFDVIVGGHDSRQEFTNLSSVFDPFTNSLAARAKEKVIESGGAFSHASYNFLLTAAYIDFLATSGRARIVNNSTLRLTSGHTARIASVNDVVGFATETDPGAAGFEPDIRDARVLQIHLGPDGEPQRVQVNPDGTPVRVGGAFVPDPDGKYILVPTLIPDTSWPRTLTREKVAETGFELEFYPSIALDSMELEVTMSESYISGMTPQGYPIISEFSAASDARLADGQPLVLAGMKRETQLATRSGAPWLSKIPGLGLLFGGVNKAASRKMLVAVIVPRFYSLSPNPDERRDWTEGEEELPAGVYGPVPSDAATTMAMAEGDAAAPLPPSMIGFDQWLLDGATF